MRRLVLQYRNARAHAEEDQKKAETAARRLATRLSRRDAADLLEISHQRVQQLAEKRSA
jgi:hypothetical protein